jgi:hypothetical protein
LDAPTDDRPIVFLAFKHNRVVSRIARKVRDDLALRVVFAYRGMDDPHPGWPLQQRLDTWIQRADGVVIFWSGQGSKSPAVINERTTAKRLKKRICLIKFPGIAEPADWSGEEWLDLKGVRFGIFGPQFINPAWNPEWSRFVDVIAGFARDARDERVPPLPYLKYPPNPSPYH